MHLFIDTSHDSQIRVAVFDGQEIVSKKTANVGRRYTERILTLIDEVSGPKEPADSGIKSILVVTGPGRFSALRTGVTTANILAWSLNIPVLAVRYIEADKLYWQQIALQLLSEIKKNKHRSFHKPLLPAYGQEPNISQSKKGLY